jgi:type IV pilus assembly protein PilO
MKLGIREILFVVLMLGMLGSSYVFVFKPAAEKRVARQEEMARKRKELADVRQATAGIGNIEAKIQELQEAIKFFDAKLPQEKEIDKILNELWQLAQQNRLQTETIKTMKSERFAGYSEQPITMSLAGDCMGFHSFLKQLERLSRITRVSHIKMEKLPNREGEVRAQMTISIFFESGGNGSRVASMR